MGYSVIDLETGIKNRGSGAVGKFKASPFDPKNKIVYAGLSEEGTYYPYTAGIPFPPDANYLVVGQNIKFDLLYLLRGEGWRHWAKTGRIWDTMLAEYILSGQEHKNWSLDKLAVKYKYKKLKDERLKELWESDVDTEDIDTDIILPYLENDVKCTEHVFRAQIQEAKKNGMLPLLYTQMDALLATTEMEYNGLHFNKEDALGESYIMVYEIDLMHKELCKDMKAHLPKQIVANPGSLDQVSAVLFGGTLHAQVYAPMLDEFGNAIKYKSGPNKGAARTKIVRKPFIIDGMGFVPKNPDWAVKKNGFYKVNDEVLKELDCSFGNKLMKYRKMLKDYKTYYIGYTELVWPHDNCIHPQFNHALTGTGRLSHSNPNVGNVSHDE